MDEYRPGPGREEVIADVQPGFKQIIGVVIPTDGESVLREISNTFLMEGLYIARNFSDGARAVMEVRDDLLYVLLEIQVAEELDTHKERKRKKENNNEVLALADELGETGFRRIALVIDNPHRVVKQRKLRARLLHRAETRRSLLLVDKNNAAALIREWATVVLKK